MNITVLIPTIPARRRLLGRAVASVATQTARPVRTLVEADRDRQGAARTRNRALLKVDTEYVAFLDDDDELYPQHLRLLARCATLTGADVVYPDYDCTGPDPVDLTESGWARRFDPGMLRRTNYIPVTTLCRTEAVRKAGGFQPHPDVNGDPCEDWGLWLAMLDNGCQFTHLPVTTWRWHNDGTTTKGRGSDDQHRSGSNTARV